MNSETQKEITADYIRGLIDGEGCFSFCTIPRLNSTGKRIKLPAFILQMHERDKDLVEEVKKFLKLRANVRSYRPYRNDGINRGKTARLIARDFSDLRDKIIPIFYKQLIGYKAIQFNEWIEKIGTDPDVHKDYRVLSYLYKTGYFDNKSVYR